MISEPNIFKNLNDNVVEIFTPQGISFFINLCHLDKIKNYKWNAVKNKIDNTYYIRAFWMNGYKTGSILLHRLIMKELQNHLNFWKMLSNLEMN